MKGYNPYVILEIRESADEHEIKRAMRKKIDMYCGKEGNTKNADGEYLREIFLKAAKDLLDPQNRRKIDEELARKRKENGVIPYVNKEKKMNGSEETKSVKESITIYKDSGDFRDLQNKNFENDEKVSENRKYNSTYKAGNVVIYSINELLLNVKLVIVKNKNINKIQTMIPLDNVFAYLGKDLRFKFVSIEHSFYYHRPYIFEYDCAYMSDIFSANEVNIYNNGHNDFTYCKNRLIFKVNGIDSCLFHGFKFIPSDLINNGYIGYKTLKELEISIQKYLEYDSSLVADVFSKSSEENLYTSVCESALLPVIRSIRGQLINLQPIKNSILNSFISKISDSDNSIGGFDMKDKYIVFGQDNSVTFARISKDEGLVNLFTGQGIRKSFLDRYNIDFRDTNDAKVFSIDGIPSFAIQAERVIPSTLFDESNNKISYNNLKVVNNVIAEYLIYNPEFLKNSFNSAIIDSSKVKKKI